MPNRDHRVLGSRRTCHEGYGRTEGAVTWRPPRLREAHRAGVPMRRHVATVVAAVLVLMLAGPAVAADPLPEATLAPVATPAPEPTLAPEPTPVVEASPPAEPTAEPATDATIAPTVAPSRSAPRGDGSGRSLDRRLQERHERRGSEHRQAKAGRIHGRPHVQPCVPRLVGAAQPQQVAALRNDPAVLRRPRREHRGRRPDYSHRRSTGSMAGFRPPRDRRHRRARRRRRRDRRHRASTPHPGPQRRRRLQLLHLRSHRSGATARATGPTSPAPSGRIDNGIGVVGVAPGVRLWAVKILDDEGFGFLSWYVCGLDWIAAQRDPADAAPTADSRP